MSSIAKWLRLDAAACALCLLLAACSSDPTEVEQPPDMATEETAPVTNRIDVPPKVIRNLGITFVEVEERRIQGTLRVPGRFESPPEAHRRYDAPVKGRLNLHVGQYETVETGELLASIDSPEWARMRAQIADAQAAVQEAAGGVSVIEAERSALEQTLELYERRVASIQPMINAGDTHLEDLKAARDVWENRVKELEELRKEGAGKAGDLAAARAELKSAISDMSAEREKRAGYLREQADLRTEREDRSAELKVIDRRIEAAREHLKRRQDVAAQEIAAAASAIGADAATLAEDDHWRAIDSIEIRADRPGRVADLHVSDGAWVEAGASLVHVLDESRVRFRAQALQADLGEIRDGMPGRVAPPRGGSLERAPALDGVIRLTPEADPNARTIDVVLTPESAAEWARPGVTAELEIITDDTVEPVPAVPLRSVIQDGLDMVLFYRDPKDPSKVVRATPILGETDGHWIHVRSAVMAGHEVVLDGVYELKLTGSGKPPEGGHHHADGTFHAGDDH